MPRCYDTDIIAEQETLTFSLNNDIHLSLYLDKTYPFGECEKFAIIQFLRFYQYIGILTMVRVRRN